MSGDDVTPGDQMVQAAMAAYLRLPASVNDPEVIGAAVTAGVLKRLAGLIDTIYGQERGQEQAGKLMIVLRPATFANTLRSEADDVTKRYTEEKLRKAR